MRVIDLLNKIANGEEVPKKIKYKDNIYEYVNSWYFSAMGKNAFALYISGIMLSDEVEIIEEDNKIEKINNAYYHDSQDNINEKFKNKINEIIDEINKLKEEK